MFTLSADRVLVIQAKDIREAVSDVEKNWYPNAFDDPFEVKIATGLSFKDHRPCYPRGIGWELKGGEK